jgi:hypothetical protein
MKRATLLCCSVLLALSAVRLSAGIPGSSTMGFLRIEPDARSMGMAGAVSALANDEFASYWNPAAISKVPGLGVGISHIFWFSDMNGDVLSSAYSVPRVGSFGFSASALYAGTAPEALDANAGSLNAPVDIGFYSVNLSYAIEPYLVRMGVTGAKLYLGGTVKYLHERLYSYSRSAVAFDAAFLGESIFLEDVNFALVLRNLGPSVRLKRGGAAESLPFEYTVGLSYSWEVMTRERDSFVITPALDLSAPNDYRTVFRGGLEAQWKSGRQDLTVALRLGFASPQDSLAQNGARAGVGFRFKKVSVDYAFAFHDPLDNVHRLTLKYAFK